MKRIMEGDDDNDLAKAARAGILLLEKNKELSVKNSELTDRIQAIDSELRKSKESLGLVRRESIVESHQLEKQLKATKEELSSEKAKSEMLQNQLAKYQTQIEDLQYQIMSIESQKEQTEITNTTTTATFEDNNNNENESKTPEKKKSAATISSSEHALVLSYLEVSQDEKRMLERKVAELSQQLDTRKTEVSSLKDLKLVLEEYKTSCEMLEASNARLVQEQQEERAVIASLRQMLQTYKSIAESSTNNISSDKSTSLSQSPPPPVSFNQEIILENAELREKLASVSAQLTAATKAPTAKEVRSLRAQCTESLQAQTQLQECNAAAEAQIRTLLIQVQQQTARASRLFSDDDISELNSTAAETQFLFGEI